MVTIWSFHLQYGAPPAIYLKAPTLMYVFILIALRTLRFEPGYVLLCGAAAALGWLLLVAYALLDDPRVMVTHNFAVYAMSYSVLVGAEVDKVVSILVVTLILALALHRARGLLGRALREQQAGAHPSRLFAPAIAGPVAPGGGPPGAGVARAAGGRRPLAFLRAGDRRPDRPGRAGPRAGPGGAARGGGAGRRPARLHAAIRPAIPAPGDGAAGRLSGPDGGGDPAARRQRRQVPGRRHPGELRGGAGLGHVRGRRGARGRGGGGRGGGLGGGAAGRRRGAARGRGGAGERAGHVRLRGRPRPAR